MKLNLFFANIFSGSALVVNLMDINKIVALVVGVTAILLNLKRLFEKPKK